MLEFDKELMTEEELRELTKNYLGIRYRTNKKDGSFEAYMNAWTLLVDVCKWIRNKML